MAKIELARSISCYVVTDDSINLLTIRLDIDLGTLVRLPNSRRTMAVRTGLQFQASLCIYLAIAHVGS